MMAKNLSVMKQLRMWANISLTCIERAKLTAHELPEHLTSGKKFYDYYRSIP